jgi:hypothetical protein
VATLRLHAAAPPQQRLLALAPGLIDVRRRLPKIQERPRWSAPLE